MTLKTNEANDIATESETNPRGGDTEAFGRKRIEEMTPNERIQAAIELAVRYGGIDGAHHKAWVIDQMVRALAGERYETVVAEAKSGEDGSDSYDWDEGICP